MCARIRDLRGEISFINMQSIVPFFLTLTVQCSIKFNGEMSLLVLPCGTFLLQTPTIDLFCLLIFIASQDGCTALPVSCISYSLSFSTLAVFFSFSTPLNSISASHLWVHPLVCLLFSLSSVTFHLSLSDCVSLMSLCCVYLMADLSYCDSSFLTTVCELFFHIYVFYTAFSPGRSMSRPFILLPLCLFMFNKVRFPSSVLGNLKSERCVQIKSEYLCESLMLLFFKFGFV